MSVILTEKQYAELRDGGMLAHYSAALDEIYLLRTAAAFEAQTLQWVLSFSTLPKKVRVVLQNMQGRLKATACGWDAYDYLTAQERYDALANCKGAPMTLTRHEWETKR